jgi:hypothetical protein
LIRNGRLATCLIAATARRGDVDRHGVCPKAQPAASPSVIARNEERNEHGRECSLVSDPELVVAALCDERRFRAHALTLDGAEKLSSDPL